MKRMKKIIPVLFCAVFVLTFVLSFGMKANAAETASGTCGENVTWEYDGNGTMTISGSGKMNDFFGAKPWNDVKDKVTEIVIEEGVENIGHYAFHNFSNVTRVTIPDTVTSIGVYAFSGNNLSEINIPDKVTVVDNNAFADNPNLTSIVIPETVTELGTSIIARTSVKNVTLKADMEYTDWYLFEDCTTIENLIIEKGVIGYGVAGDAKDSVKNITIGAGVREIRYGAFSAMAALEKVTLEEGIYTELGEEAFLRCTALKEIVIPKTVKIIGKFAFRGCESLEKVTFFENLEEIGAYCFADCSSLKEAEIPLSVTKIGSYAFNGFVTEEEGKEESFTGGEDFLIRGYINTEAEKYASRSVYHCTFEPIGGDISVCAMAFSPSSFEYDGTAKEPAVTVKTPLSGTELVCGIMYTEPVYANNIEPGNASATVTGIGKWTGTLTKTFKIAGEVSGGDKPINPTISEEEMMRMKEVLIEYGVITPDTKKFTEREYELTIMIFAEYGYSADDAEFFMQSFGYWGGAPIPEEWFGEEPVYRVYGQSRYETSYKTADVLKEQLGVDKFDTAIVAYGKNFPDALAGSYLAGKTNAPILMINDKFADELTAYVKENVEKGGKIYVLGGEGAIPDSQLRGLGEYEVCRLAGQTRYETNLKILEEAGVENQDILVCTGKTFADSLSASATGNPILLVNNNTLTAEQKAFLSQHKGGKFYIIGGEGAVSERMADEIRAYGKVERIYGNSRYETSVKLAEKFFSDAEVSVLASAKNFPDGLCGGPLAMSKNAPLILTATGKETAAVEYMNKNHIGIGAVLGGDSLISDEAVEVIYGVPSISIW